MNMLSIDIETLLYICTFRAYVSAVLGPNESTRDFLAVAGPT